VLIAAGGAGQVYSDTTNPAVATGDGIALAAQAGAELADMEFYQFHPTALSLPGVPRFLLSEALRGEGAYLRNDRGERFMERYHPLLELAPRDVVARAIAREGMGTAPERVGETRHRASGYAPHQGHRPAPALPRHQRSWPARPRSGRDLIPVRPAAHYLMGGIKTDLGRPHQSAGPLRRRRGRLHRRSRRQSPGLQLAARRAGLRRARRTVDAGRQSAPA
jgi:L-aspartate oxidase